jgi:hypothetical protein
MTSKNGLRSRSAQICASSSTEALSTRGIPRKAIPIWRNGVGEPGLCGGQASPTSPTALAQG